MPLWMQHIFVLTLVAACLAFVGRQVYLTLRKGTGKVGACCNKGCGGETASPAPRAVFIPIESLGRPGKGRLQ